MVHIRGTHQRSHLGWLLFEPALSAAVADSSRAGTVEASLLSQPMASRNKQKLAHHDVLSADYQIQSGESVVHTAEEYGRTQGGSTCVGRFPGAFPSPVAS